MKNTLLPIALVLSITGYRVMAQHDSAMTEQSMSPACALAVAAALEDLRAWFSEGHPAEPIGFETYLQQSYGSVVCGEIEGRRIAVAWRQSVGRGGGVWYAIDADSFEVVERVFGR